jgi:Ca-activated chloride channel homolog
MAGVFFEIDFLALGLSILFLASLLLVLPWKKSFLEPQIFFSDLKDLEAGMNSWRARLAKLPLWLGYASLGCFLLAFIDPHFLVPKKNVSAEIPTEGIAIYLLLDQSGSMTEKVHTMIGDKLISIPKIDLLKQITAEFVKGDPALKLEGRPNDLIGMIAFARTAHVVVPLTLDHSAILRQLSKLDAVKNKEDDGTAMGYAIYKTVNIIAATRYYAQKVSGGLSPAYDIKSSIIVLVTDGFADPSILDKDNPLRNMDLPEAAEYAAKNHVRLYVVDIDPALGSSEYAPQRRQMNRITELTGGKYYLMDSATGLDQIYGEIDKLEKSRLGIYQGKVEESKDNQPKLYHRISLYPYLIFIGMLALFFSIALSGSILRKVP